jgi:hypothetical protein
LKARALGTIGSWEYGLDKRRIADLRYHPVTRPGQPGEVLRGHHLAHLTSPRDSSRRERPGSGGASTATSTSIWVRLALTRNGNSTAARDAGPRNREGAVALAPCELDDAASS